MVTNVIRVPVTRSRRRRATALSSIAGLPAYSRRLRSFRPPAGGAETGPDHSGRDLSHCLQTAGVHQHKVGARPGGFDIADVGQEHRIPALGDDGLGCAPPLGAVACDAAGQAEVGGRVHINAQIEESADHAVVEQQDAIDEQNLSRRDGLTETQAATGHEAIAWGHHRLALPQCREVRAEKLLVQGFRHVEVERSAGQGVEASRIMVVGVVGEPGHTLDAEIGRERLH